MRMPVVADLRVDKFRVLKNVVKALEREEVKSALSRNGITPVNESLDILKVIIALYLELEFSYFIQELKGSKRLERVMDLSFTPEVGEVYEFMARLEEETFRKSIEQAINSVFGAAGRGSMVVVLDTSGIDLDLNRDRNRKKNENLELEGKEYRWGRDGNKFYIGFKLAFIIDYRTKKPLLFLIYSANIHESQIYEEILETMRNKGILKKGTVILADKGFCSYNNYNIALKKYKVVPVILLKKNMSIGKLLTKISTPITCFIDNKLRITVLQKSENTYQIKEL